MATTPDRLELARLPTPVRRASVLSAQLHTELLIKRDDLTGAALSGNKVRKLEYLLAEARAQACDTLVTCGGEQSNHCRATAVAAAQLGLRSVLLLRTADPTRPPPLQGNSLLDHLVGAGVRWVSPDEYKERARLFEAMRYDMAAAGHRPYFIPEGGSNALGAWGYIRCVEELAAQLGREPVTLVCATGSGGTLAGLVLGIKLLELPWRAVGINVCDDRAYFVRAVGAIIDDAVERFHLSVSFDRAELEICDGYVGTGYAQSRPEELRVLRDVARAEGLLLDPVYTGKAYGGLVAELQRDPNRWGGRVCFIHTGGIYGLFSKAAELSAVL
ncbi:MAG TPA: D-cysteine desulfhydrase family protein [Myxococcota bacterium]|nr:D-cysteine desulfhydrase family protein [Myxococcota bacterium]